ncbi:putative MFS family arabinose efflux permease [Pseudaminobacter salicylatoxidans]|uniref:Putative MFS family arabinose efflux permease n=1 Tax=Pseudaminobacter salicylatoxidans TaxID=93369 RepID=A0A316C318_PSESE|nr:MFS transporter [Pseudaminobacter salicylatoxidans]PWJ82241.1 putative MFS family arabinose efflux permease [Pseudaminobacter salicylatoxidans]
MPAVKALLPTVSALLFSVAILITGNGLQWTLIPVRASLELFDPLEIGLLGSSYYLGFALGCLLGGHVIQRVGHIRAFTALTAVASTVVMIHALTSSPAVWWGLRAVTGFCFAGLYLVIESWLNERASNDNRGMVMGIYTMINLSVTIVGQMMLALGNPADFLLFALASILISLAAVPVALTASRPPARLLQSRLRPVKLYSRSPVGVVGVLLAGVATGAFWSLGPAYVIAFGADTAEVAIFMSIAVLGGALVQWPLGRLSDRCDRRIVVLGLCGVGVLAALTLALINIEDRVAISVLVAAFGASALPLYAISAAHAFDHINAEDTVETSSGLLLANGLGAIAGPVAAASLMGPAGPGGLFLATAGAHLLLASFVSWRIRTSAPVPREERSEFNLATTAPTMVALTPEEKEIVD